MCGVGGTTLPASVRCLPSKSTHLPITGIHALLCHMWLCPKLLGEGAISDVAAEFVTKVVIVEFPMEKSNLTSSSLPIPNFSSSLPHKSLTSGDGSRRRSIQLHQIPCHVRYPHQHSSYPFPREEVANLYHNSWQA